MKKHSDLEGVISDKAVGTAKSLGGSEPGSSRSSRETNGARAEQWKKYGEPSDVDF